MWRKQIRRKQKKDSGKTESGESFLYQSGDQSGGQAVPFLSLPFPRTFSVCGDSVFFFLPWERFSFAAEEDVSSAAGREGAAAVAAAVSSAAWGNLSEALPPLERGAGDRAGDSAADGKTAEEGESSWERRGSMGRR